MKNFRIDKSPTCICCITKSYFRLLLLFFGTFNACSFGVEGLTEVYLRFFLASGTGAGITSSGISSSTEKDAAGGACLTAFARFGFFCF